MLLTDCLFPRKHSFTCLWIIGEGKVNDEVILPIPANSILRVYPTETNPQVDANSEMLTQSIDQVVDGSRLIYKAVQDPIKAGYNCYSTVLEQVIK